MILNNKINKIKGHILIKNGHVYDPFSAVANLKRMLKNDGVIYGYVPYLFHYHAPNDLKFQDYFRFSKDALAYLFREFSDVELFPVRGRISTPLNIMFAGRWKKYAEKTSINILLDKFVSDWIDVIPDTGTAAPESAIDFWHGGLHFPPDEE